MRYYSYINTAVQLLKTYKGEEPFAQFIKTYFSQNKKFGSTDRKQVSHLCYCYFRLGKTAIELSIEERILLGLYLCSVSPNDILQAIKPEWNDKVCLPLEEKYPALQAFSFIGELSDGIDKAVFNISHYQQPDLFLRLRPGKEDAVQQQLLQAKIPFTQLNNNCLALPNASKIEEVLKVNRDVVIQDYSSQQIQEFLKLLPLPLILPWRVWDCCAASGGKSILAKDVLKNIKLTVSDIRASVLANLKKRFTTAGIVKYQSFLCDLSRPVNIVAGEPFELIIADVPCSGSGTWGRTPEQLCFFKAETIEKYNALQRTIVSNAISHLSDNGYLLYTTCSVFKKENEEVARFITDNFPLTLVKMEPIKGYEFKADTMFAGLFKKN
jgi:16S rRNA (cytosine967-C5)-methyltransferase